MVIRDGARNGADRQLVTLASVAVSPRDLRHLEDPAGELIATMQSVAERVGYLLEESKKQASGHLAVAAAAELPRAIDRLVMRRTWRLWLLGCFLVGGLMLLSAVGGYLMRGSPLPDVECRAESGGVVCYYWAVPASKQGN